MSGKNRCTDIQWLGRADCENCGVRQLMIFSGLPETAFNLDLAPIDHLLLPGGKTLFRQGQNDGVVFTVRKGLVKLLCRTDNGDQRIVRLVGSKSAIGLELLDSESSYHHTAITVGEADVCRIPVATLHILDERYPVLCHQIRSRIQSQLAQADDWIVHMATGPSMHRVANLLIFLQQEASSEEGTFPLLSGGDMAAIVGSAPETVSRNIAQLKRDGVLVKVAPGTFRADRTALEALAGQGG